MMISFDVETNFVERIEALAQKEQRSRSNMMVRLITEAMETRLEKEAEIQTAKNLPGGTNGAQTNPTGIV